jgi:hypothetical protein
MDDEPKFELRATAEVETGVYANFLSVWHTGHEFTLDFAATQQVEPSEHGGMVVPCRIVARVKVPPTLAFDIIQTLNANMTRYEETFGEIRRPETRPREGEPPFGGDLPLA